MVTLVIQPSVSRNIMGGLVKSTAPYRPWKLITYLAFDSQKLAKDFERYLKSGSGKAFTYKRLVDSEALREDDGMDAGTP